MLYLVGAVFMVSRSTLKFKQGWHKQSSSTSFCLQEEIQTLLVLISEEHALYNRELQWPAQLVSSRKMSVCSCFIPFWLVGSLYWCCQCFCSPAKGRAGAGGREGIGSSKAGSSILESRQSTEAGSGCNMFPVSSKLGGIAFYLAFFYCLHRS